MGIIEHIFRRRDLGVIDSLIGAGVLVVAVFAWVERTSVVDPNTELSDNWKWQLWQIPPLVFSLVGVWLLWRNTSRVPWVRTLCLSTLALAILFNQYTDVFDHSNNLWYTIDPLFLACATVAICTGWQQVVLQRRGFEPVNPFTLITATISTGLAIAVFIFAFFFFLEEIAWDILDPLLILALLTWASSALRVNVGDAT